MQLKQGSRVLLKSGKKVYDRPAFDTGVASPAAATYTNSSSGLADLGAAATGWVFALTFYVNGQHYTMTWVELQYASGKRYAGIEDVLATDGTVFTGGSVYVLPSTQDRIPAPGTPARPQLLYSYDTGDSRVDNHLQTINGATNYAARIAGLLKYIEANQGSYSAQQLAQIKLLAEAAGQDVNTLQQLIISTETKARQHGLDIQLANPYSGSGLGFAPIVAWIAAYAPYIITAVVSIVGTAAAILWNSLSSDTQVASNTYSGLASKYNDLSKFEKYIPAEQQQMYRDTIATIANNAEASGYAKGKPGLFGELGSTVKWGLGIAGFAFLYGMYKDNKRS